MTFSKPKSFSQLLRDARHARGETLRSLASKAGVHYSYISDMEHGRRPSGQKVADRLAEALEMHDDLRDAFLLAAADASPRERLHRDVAKLPGRVLNVFAMVVAKAMRDHDAIQVHEFVGDGTPGRRLTDCLGQLRPEYCEELERPAKRPSGSQKAGRVAKFYVNMRLEDFPAEKGKKLLQQWPGFHGPIDLAVELADGTWQIWEFKTLKL